MKLFPTFRVAVKRIPRHSKFDLKSFYPLVTLVVIFFFILISWTFKPNWQFDGSQIRTPIRDSIAKLEKYNYITHGTVGYSARIPQQLHRIHFIQEEATDKELLKLIEYPNAEVKAISYEELLKRGSQDSYKLMRTALSDTSSFVGYAIGCESELLLIGEYLIEECFDCETSSTSKLKSCFFKQFEFSIDEEAEIKSLFVHQMERKEKYLKDFFDR